MVRRRRGRTEGVADRLRVGAWRTARSTTTRRFGVALAALAGAFVAAACTGREPLEVLSPLPRDVLDALERAYEEAHAGIDLRIERTDDAAGLVAVLTGETTPDVWVGAPRHHLLLAGGRGLLRGDWTPLTSSPVVLALNRDSVPLAQAPRDWIDLFHPRWNDELVLSDPARAPSMRAMIEGAWLQELRRTGDERAGADWLLRLDGVARGYVDDDAEALRSLRVGAASFALLPLHAVLEDGGASWLAWRPMESGGPAVERGAGVLAGSPRAAAAAELVAWLAGPEGRSILPGERGWLDPAAEGDLPGGAVGERLRGYPVWVWSEDTVVARGEEWMTRWDREVKGRGRERILP